MKTPQRILVPTDFSKHSEKALTEAIGFAKKFDAQIYLLHVVEDIQACAFDYCISEELIAQYKTDSVAASRDKLDQAVKKFGLAENVRMTADVRLGIPYDEILKEEQEKDIDLIIIATHGKTGFLHHIMGGVAERVLRGAKCIVMLVKP
ncbi:MAG: Universal stress protein A [Syntrophus sp. SKADARSKE-3]|nr:Universal stress protein A [Syntrophus sp. SKADARSKE-3]